MYSTQKNCSLVFFSFHKVFVFSFTEAHRCVCQYDGSSGSSSLQVSDPSVPKYRSPKSPENKQQQNISGLWAEGNHEKTQHEYTVKLNGCKGWKIWKKD